MNEKKKTTLLFIRESQEIRRKIVVYLLSQTTWQTKKKKANELEVTHWLNNNKRTHAHKQVFRKFIWYEIGKIE